MRIELNSNSIVALDVTQEGEDLGACVFRQRCLRLMLNLQDELVIYRL